MQRSHPRMIPGRSGFFLPLSFAEDIHFDPFSLPGGTAGGGCNLFYEDDNEDPFSPDFADITSFKKDFKARQERENASRLHIAAKQDVVSHCLSPSTPLENN